MICFPNINALVQCPIVRFRDPIWGTDCRHLHNVTLKLCATFWCRQHKWLPSSNIGQKWLQHCLGQCDFGWGPSCSDFRSASTRCAKKRSPAGTDANLWLGQRAKPACKRSSQFHEWDRPKFCHFKIRVEPIQKKIRFSVYLGHTLARPKVIMKKKFFGTFPPTRNIFHSNLEYQKCIVHIQWYSWGGQLLYRKNFFSW